MLRTVIHAESVIGHGEMAEALGAVLEASNSDPASSGFSPAQAMLGKQPRGLGMDGGPAVGLAWMVVQQWVIGWTMTRALPRGLLCEKWQG